MTDYDWKPGDVAMVTRDSRRTAIGVWVDDCTNGDHWFSGGVKAHWHTSDGHWATSYRDARPLAVLDPESEEDRVKLRNAAAGYTNTNVYATMTGDAHTRWGKRMRWLLTVAEKPSVCDANIRIGEQWYTCTMVGEHKKHTIPDLTVEW